jgi:hypothetical protein
MDLTLKEEYWTKFYMKLIAVIYPELTLSDFNYVTHVILYMYFDISIFKGTISTS